MNPVIVRYSRLSVIKASTREWMTPHAGHLAVWICKHPGEDLT